jgi:hypothetical protein
MRRINGLTTLAASFALSWSVAAADAGTRAQKFLFGGDIVLRKRTQTQESTRPIIEPGKVKRLDILEKLDESGCAVIGGGFALLRRRGGGIARRA